MRKLNPQLRKGLAAVEFAVALPLLVFVFLATVDFARVLYVAITVDNCTHNGAIFGAQVYDNQNQQWIGNNQYWQGPTGELITTEQAAAIVDGSNIAPALTTSNVTTTTGTDSLGNPVTIVTISYDFKTISQFPWIPSTLTITRTVQARIAPAVPAS